MRSLNLAGRVAAFALSLACCVRVTSAGGPKAGTEVVTGHVELKKPREASSVQEIDEYELMRMNHEMTAEDSVAWLKSMTPGTEILWVDRASKGILINVEMPAGHDTLRADVVQDTSVVRSLPPMTRDRAGICRVRWDLRSDAKTKVEPGLYVVGMGSGKISKVFYIVVTAGH